MFKCLKIAALAFLAIASVSLVACSDDNNDGPDPTPDPVVKHQDPNPKSVYPLGVPKSIGRDKIITNSNGWVTSITSTYLTMIFDYTGSTFPTETTKSNYSDSYLRPKTYDATMAMEWVDMFDATYYMKLNEQGYVEYAYEEYLSKTGSEVVVSEWWFKYNDAGQVEEIRRINSHKNEYYYTLTYNSDGDVTTIYSPGYQETTLLYVDVKNPKPIDNKGGIIFVIDCYDIDEDFGSLNYIAMAGLMGKGTAHLPTSTTTYSEYFNKHSWYTHVWTLDASNIPTSYASWMSYEDKGDFYGGEKPIVW